MGKHKILIVDDLPQNLQLMRQVLAGDYQLSFATDGELAIAAAEKHMPDLILMDIMMPNMDGYEFATHVRNDERVSDVPIIMITSRVGDKHRARAIELGVNDYLGKPYQDSQLLDAMRRLLEERGIQLQ